MFSGHPPLGLYIHLPWCEKKCPYCDFNSYQADDIPEQAYVEALLKDLEQDLPLVWGRSIYSIFIGGGTPSLFSPDAIERLFSGLRALLNFAPAIEITMESNPGSAESANYRGYREAGVNRLSIGVQSFNDRNLRNLDRAHDAMQAKRAFALARDAGFSNINLDLMFGLPGQQDRAAQADLAQALELAPEHLSYYQLTIEPNTVFHSRPPQNMPDDETGWRLQTGGQSLLERQGYRQYEVSAYCKKGCESRHNLNYWRFGDYLGIGAGAHGKITFAGENRVIRRERQRQPRAYVENAGRDNNVSETHLSEEDLCFEFMLNALRLKHGFNTSLFHENTGLELNRLLPALDTAKKRGLIEFDSVTIRPSETGFDHLNELQAIFLKTEPLKTRPFFHSAGEIIHN